MNGNWATFYWLMADLNALREQNLAICCASTCGCQISCSNGSCNNLNNGLGVVFQDLV
jgi:hypothetical protein